MDDGGLVVRVECYAGYQGEETPRCLYLGPRRIRVASRSMPFFIRVID